jgi:YVTN family beta-propeller protein
VGTKSVPLVYDLAPVGSILWVSAPNPQDPSVNAIMKIDLRRPNAAPAVAVVRTSAAFGWLAADRHGVWYTDTLSDRVLHIDGKTLRIDHRIAVGNTPVLVTEGEGAVWVVNTDDGTVSRIDPETARVVATIPVGPNPAGIAVGAGGVWVDVHPH